MDDKFYELIFLSDDKGEWERLSFYRTLSDAMRNIEHHSHAFTNPLQGSLQMSLGIERYYHLSTHGVYGIEVHKFGKVKS